MPSRHHLPHVQVGSNTISFPSLVSSVSASATRLVRKSNIKIGSSPDNFISFKMNFQFLVHLTETEGFGMCSILGRKTKTVETIRHKTVENLLGLNEIMEFLAICVFIKLEKRDIRGCFDVWIEFFILFTTCRGLIFFSDDVKRFQSCRTFRLSRRTFC